MAASDSELLHRYSRDADQAAFAELIRRRIGAVYAAARRQVGEAQLAEDVTQAVFILLSRRAGQLHGDVALARWLFTATRYSAANARRVRDRRLKHERAAAVEITARRLSEEADDVDPQLLQLLDAAIAALSVADRDSLMLSFFQQKTYREVGAALGVSEDAARQRVRRSIERLRQYFAQHGVVTGTTAIEASLLAHTVAPDALIESTINLLSLAPALHGGAAAGIAQGVNRMWMIAKLKVAAAVTGAATVAAVVAAPIVASSQPQNLSKPLVDRGAPIYASTAGDAPQTLAIDGAEIQVLGIARYSGGDWWTIDGKKVDGDPSIAPWSIHIEPEPTHQLVVRVKAAIDAAVRVNVTNTFSTGQTQQEVAEGETQFLQVFNLKPDQTTADVQISIADGPFTRVAESGGISEGRASVRAGAKEFGGIYITEAIREDNAFSVYVATEMIDYQWTVLCVDGDNVEHAPVGNELGSAGKISAGRFKFDVPLENVKSVVVEARPFAKKVVAKNITLDPAKPTGSKLEVVK